REGGRENRRPLTTAKRDANNLWLACHTQDEIAEAVGWPQQSVADRLRGITENGYLPNPVIPPIPTRNPKKATTTHRSRCRRRNWPPPTTLLISRRRSTTSGSSRRRSRP